ncbi:MAG: hypothetical protein EA425_00340 [Puniceicoccaceae bacterium]|nr:MAG: hypothetical protein EA425_00340 [Puniceicoccaceae bacterium]
MVTQGREEVSVRIRFQDGGSLSLRLTLENGLIRPQFTTTVAGLENAIKTHWSDLADEWQQRGLRLGQPGFSSDSGSGRNQDDREETAAPAFPGTERSSRSASRSTAAANAAAPSTLSPDAPGLRAWA